LENKTDVEQLHVFFKTKKENKTSLKWGKKISLKEDKIKSFYRIFISGTKNRNVLLVRIIGAMIRLWQNV
jgi:hypothetical protein